MSFRWLSKTGLFYRMRCGAKTDLALSAICHVGNVLGKTVLEFPLVIVVEAKKNDFEQGWGQCLAELVAAQKLNNEASRPAYGIVTDGELWKFGLLVGDTFVSNKEGYTVGDLPALFGALYFIFTVVSATIDSR